MEYRFVAYLDARGKGRALRPRWKRIGLVAPARLSWWDRLTGKTFPRRIVWYRVHGDPEDANRHFIGLRRLGQPLLAQLVESDNPEWRDLYPDMTEDARHEAIPIAR